MDIQTLITLHDKITPYYITELGGIYRFAEYIEGEIEGHCIRVPIPSFEDLKNITALSEYLPAKKPADMEALYLKLIAVL